MSTNNEPKLVNSKQKQITMHQPKIWDYINLIEIPIVQFFQYIFCVQKTFDLWEYIAELASSKVGEHAPFLLYALGRPKEAYDLARCIVLYSIISSLGKFLLQRRRPCSYPKQIYCPNPAATSGFPSRHTISLTIISSFTPYKWFLVPLIILGFITNKYIENKKTSLKNELTDDLEKTIREFDLHYNYLLENISFKINNITDDISDKIGNSTNISESEMNKLSAGNDCVGGA